MLIEKGFEVKINKVRIKPRPVKLYFESPDKLNKQVDLIRPYVYESKQGNVSVFLAVGYRSPIKTQQELDDEAKSSFAAKEAGWTVICNNRVVLANDRSVKTGWGLGGVPNFHNQFSCIAGIVEFRSPNAADLPITTTKRGIDTGKDIYAIIRQRMQDGLRYFTKNTNRWKGEEGGTKGAFSGFTSARSVGDTETGGRFAIQSNTRRRWTQAIRTATTRKEEVHHNSPDQFRTENHRNRKRQSIPFR